MKNELQTEITFQQCSFSTIPSLPELFFRNMTQDERLTQLIVPDEIKGERHKGYLLALFLKRNFLVCADQSSEKGKGMLPCPLALFRVAQCPLRLCAFFYLENEAFPKVWKHDMGETDPPYYSQLFEFLLLFDSFLCMLISPVVAEKSHISNSRPPPPSFVLFF